MNRAIIVASFGATSPSLRGKSIEPFEAAVAETFPDYKVYRAFTSPIVIDRIEKKEGIRTDDLDGALGRALSDGISDIFVIPTLPIGGIQFDSIARISERYRSRFDALTVCPPLLESRAVIDDFLESLPSAFPDAFEDGSALVMMGHGNSSVSDGCLCRLQVVSSMRWKNVFFTTATGTPSPQDIVRMLSSSDVRKIFLAPLMFEAGFHARKDMCSGNGSVKSILEENGFETECVMLGMGEIPVFRDMFLEGLRRCGA